MGTPLLVKLAGTPTFKSRPKAHIYLLYAMTAPLVNVIAVMFPYMAVFADRTVAS